jgi:hypothetical protein
MSENSVARNNYFVLVNITKQIELIRNTTTVFREDTEDESNGQHIVAMLAYCGHVRVISQVFRGLPHDDRSPCHSSTMRIRPVRSAIRRNRQKSSNRWGAFKEEWSAEVENVEEIRNIMNRASRSWMLQILNWRERSTNGESRRRREDERFRISLFRRSRKRSLKRLSCVSLG